MSAHVNSVHVTSDANMHTLLISTVANGKNGNNIIGIANCKLNSIQVLHYMNLII